MKVIQGKKSNVGANPQKKASSEICIIRIYVLAFFACLFFGAIVLRLFSLQVASYESYKALAYDQHSIFKSLIPKRGEVFLKDKEGVYPVAVNRETKMAYAVPKEVENLDETVSRISEVLGLDKDDLRKRLDKPEDMYEILKHRLSDEEIEKITSLKMKGIRLADEDYRYYPAGELASHILGFVGWKDNNFGGRYGTELYFEDNLKGEEGNIFHKKDASGGWISTMEKEIVQARDGDNLVLTIDHIIQYETEKILKSAVEKHGADRGTIIVMEPATGKILSLANYPAFSPNEYSKVENMEDFRNIAVSDPYECGSVFKTITLAAAIDGGKISPNTVFVDTGLVSQSGYNIKNSDEKSYGRQTMTEVLEKSLNTGAIYAEKSIGNRNFSDYVKRFGFGERTEADIYGEAAGNIANLKNLKSDIQFFTASFGQGITVTPLQLINAYNAVASGGVLMKPQILEKIIKSDGTEEKIEPQEIRRVLSQGSASEVSQMLASVVKNGHGKRAGVPGYLVGGKTGTAQVAKRGEKGYEEGKTIGSFVGFAPIDNPRFTVLVRIDDPKDVEWAESSAAPTFGELMKFLLEYANIEPTEKFSEKELEEFYATHTLSANFIKKEEDGKKEDEDKEKDKDKEE